MRSSLEQKHLAQRKRRAELFIGEPQNYKVCDQCQSIWRVSAGRCNLCGAYRWRTLAGEVIAIANVIGRSPFPFTAGVVPRL